MVAKLTYCRHVLSNVGRVATRDSSRTTATVQDLFVALCEDDSIYGLFKSMKGLYFVFPFSQGYLISALAVSRQFMRR